MPVSKNPKPKSSPKILLQGWPLAVDAFPEFEPKHVGAVKALKMGNATEHQQQLLWNFLMMDICKMGSLSYRSASDSDSTFAEGKKYVGYVLQKMTELILKPDSEQGI